MTSATLSFCADIGHTLFTIDPLGIWYWDEREYPVHVIAIYLTRDAYISALIVLLANVYKWIIQLKFVIVNALGCIYPIPYLSN